MIQGRARRRFGTLCAALTAAVLGSAAWTAAASGATVYATPSPDATHDCSQAHPCDIGTAVAAGPGTEVVVLPGTYSVSTALFAGNTVDIHGLAGQPRPRIVSTYAFGALQLFGADITLRHLEISTSGGIGVEFEKDGQLMEDTVVSAVGNACDPVLATGAVTLRNSICSGGNRGVGTTCNGCNETVSLRNVTAIGGAYGIAIESSPGSPSTFTVDATNTIARQASTVGADVRAAPGSTNSSVAINLDHSNYATRDEVPCGTLPCPATVTDPATGANQTMLPLFVNAMAGDFHEAAGSPTIDAGIDDPANGTSDIDGESRQIGALTDIGADERPPDATPPDGGGNPPPPSRKKCKKHRHKHRAATAKKCKKRHK
jgi:hypothetical protein